MAFIIICVLLYLIYIVAYYNFNKKSIYNNYREVLDKKFSNQQVVLNYNNFINYYRINKANWELNYDYGLIFYKPKTGGLLAIVFNEKDYFKVNRWISDTIAKNETNFNTQKRENLIEFLNYVQKDIDKAREEGRKEREKASETFMDVYKNLIKDEKKEIELDAIINASKADC